MKKTCPECHSSKLISEFSKNRVKKDGLASLCKECMRLRSRAHYKDNKEKTYQRTSSRRATIKAWWKDYKTTLKCSRCEENHPACLDFHHSDPSEKDREVAKMVCDSYSKERILSEVAKCEILCSNCHRKEHWK